MVGVNVRSEPGARFRLDSSYRRPTGSSVIVGGSPLRLFRLSAAGRRVAEAVERGEALPTGHEALTDRLYDAGAIHRLLGDEPVGGETRPSTVDVTAVVPAHMVAIAGERAPPPVRAVPGAIRTIVVDDASPRPVSVSGETAEAMVRDRNGGPGAARNTGLAEVSTPFVAFVDTDVVTPAGWLEPLLAHFRDPTVALVAPRVRSSAGGSPLVDGDEVVHGSLDLGAQEGRVSPGSRIGYVPGAAIVCRTAAVRAIGGFDESLRWGEDVDLVWRLHEAGWRCRYEPGVVVWHAARRSLRGWLGQRYRYGTSAAPLEQRHPGALAPLRISGWSAAVWALLLCRRPTAAGAVALGTAVALQRKLHDVPAAESARLAGLGHLHAGAQIGTSLRRSWWPAAVVVAVSIRRFRPWLALAAVGAPAIEWWRLGRRSRHADAAPVPALHTFVGMRLADDIAYGSGLWAGCLRARSLAALRPDLANWPPRRTSTVTRQ